MSNLHLNDEDPKSRRALLECLSEFGSTRAPLELFSNADRLVLKAVQYKRKAERLSNLAHVMQNFATDTRQLIQDQLDAMLAQHKHVLQDFKATPDYASLFEEFMSAAEDGYLSNDSLKEFHTLLHSLEKYQKVVHTDEIESTTTSKHKFKTLLSSLSCEFWPTHPNTSLDAAMMFGYMDDTGSDASIDLEYEARRDIKRRKHVAPSDIDEAENTQVSAIMPGNSVSFSDQSTLNSTHIFRGSYLDENTLSDRKDCVFDMRPDGHPHKTRKRKA